MQLGILSVGATSPPPGIDAFPHMTSIRAALTLIEMDKLFTRPFKPPQLCLFSLCPLGEGRGGGVVEGGRLVGGSCGVKREKGVEILFLLQDPGKYLSEESRRKTAISRD